MRKTTALLVLLLLGCAPGAAAQRLAPCELPGVPPPAECGELAVPEDREAPGGRTIGLRIVRLGATDAAAREPIFFLAGGPGEAAAGLAAYFAREYAALRRDRDLVLVDQRGTGGSNPLRCDFYGDPGDLASHAGPFVPLTAARDCLAGLAAGNDLAQYTTSRFADDLDEVRRTLGYERIVVYGVSYGTRVALEMMRRHPDAVAAAVLHGVTPPHQLSEYRLASHAQRALEGVLEECAADAACAAAFPTLREDVRALFARLGERPLQVEVVHPATGERGTLPLSRELAAEAVRYLLYTPGRVALLPRILHDAAAGSPEALAEFALTMRVNLVNAGANGLYLSVSCAEDLARADPAATASAAVGTYWSGYRYPELFAACEEWPRGPVPEGFHQPVASDAPVLILSGEWDPATPPSAGEAAAAHLPNALHLVVPSGGHAFDGLEDAECVKRVTEAFLRAGAAAGLDTGCIGGIRRAGFRTEPLPTRAVVLPPPVRAAIAGAYRIDGTPLQVTIETDGERLRLHTPDGARFQLVPVAPDRLRMVGMMGSYVTLGVERGQVTSARIDRAGSPPIRLVREEG